MHNSDAQNVAIFIIACSVLIAFLTGFITFIVYRYQQKQNAYFQTLEQLKISHENELLQSQIEIQEQTFSNISREIHDNIGQKLSLVKLHLNTLQPSPDQPSNATISESIKMIGESILDLSDISRSLSSEIILNNGFINALEFEVNQLNKPGMYSIRLTVTGEPVFLEANTELILFRIIQEALHNIIKHAAATQILMDLYYREETLVLTIKDNGKGFVEEISSPKNGITNMTRRAKMLNGSCVVESAAGAGTTIHIEIPLYANQQTV